MPASKNRPGHHSHQHHPPATHLGKSKKKGSAVMIAVIFVAILGLGISYFIAPGNMLSLLIGTIVGATAGYWFGHQIDKSLAKK